MCGGVERVALDKAKDMNAHAPFNAVTEHSRGVDSIRYTFEENGAEHDQRRRARREGAWVGAASGLARRQEARCCLEHYAAWSE